MAEIILFNDEENYTLESSAYEISVLIPKYLENLDQLEKEKDLALFLIFLSNSCLYRKHLRKVFEIASSFHQDFSFESSMLQSLQIELELLQQAYGQLEDGKRFLQVSLLESSIGKERMLTQMMDIFCLLGIRQDNRDFEAIVATQKMIQAERLHLQ